jgi:hypothetical protein
VNQVCLYITQAESGDTQSSGGKQLIYAGYADYPMASKETLEKRKEKKTERSQAKKIDGMNKSKVKTIMYFLFGMCSCLL